MNAGIEEILLFINKGEIISKALADAVEELDAVDMRMLSIKLFGWLRLQHRFQIEKPLQLPPQYTWWQKMPRLLEMCEGLGGLFEIVAGKMNFREGVPDCERMRVRELVMNDYKPEIIT